MTEILKRRGNLDTHRGKAMCRHREKMVIYKPGERPRTHPERANPAIAVI